MYQHFWKRILDVIMASLALLVACPIMIIMAGLIKCFLGSPIIFSQDRPGKNEKIFKLYKFRSMNQKKDEQGELLPDKQRLTTFGKILRSTSLDELPELLNILKGDMSLVGPRPLLVEYLPYYTQEEQIRHTVLPGLTIPDVLYKQLHCSWDEQLQHDIWYVHHCSFLTDCKIIIATMGKLLQRNKEQYGGYVRGKLSEERK